MNGLLRRLTRRRAAPADETPPDTPAASEPVDAPAVQPGTGGEPLPEDEQRALDERRASDEQAARELRAAEEERTRRARDVPAGLDPAEIESPPDAGARRGRMRRRIRYLRRVRELLLRDLGGFYYEVHRTAGGHQSSAHRAILETKTGRLAAIDGELDELESRLGEARPAQTVVREPGIGGTCPTCGELYGSDAHWCAHCGTPLTEHATQSDAEVVDQAIAARQAPPEVATPATAAAVPAAEPGPEPAKPARKIGWPRRKAKLEPDVADEGSPASAEPGTAGAPTVVEGEPGAASADETKTPSGDETKTPTGDEPAAAPAEETKTASGHESAAAPAEETKTASGQEPATPSGGEPAAAPDDETKTAAGGDAAGKPPADAAPGDEQPTEKLPDGPDAPGPNGDGRERPTFAERRS